MSFGNDNDEICFSFVVCRYNFFFFPFDFAVFFFLFLLFLAVIYLIFYFFSGICQWYGERECVIERERMNKMKFHLFLQSLCFSYMFLDMCDVCTKMCVIIEIQQQSNVRIICVATHD